MIRSKNLQATSVPDYSRRNLRRLFQGNKLNFRFNTAATAVPVYTSPIYRRADI